MMIRHYGNWRGIVALLAVVGGGVATGTSAQQKGLDGVAASVNGEVITYSQVRELVKPREEMLRQVFQGQDLMDKVKEARLASLKDLVDRQLVIQEFNKAGYKIPDYVVDQQINQIIREQFKGDRQKFVKELAAQGLTLTRFRQFEREKVMVQAMRGRHVKTAVFVSPNKVLDFYEKNKAEFRTKEEMKLRMIVLTDDPSEPGAKKAMADEVRKKLAEGAEFDRMAQLYSEDSSADLGGDWGWIDRTVLSPKLTELSFSLSKGQISNVIEFAGSYYILFCEDRKGGYVKPITEVRAEIQTKLEQAEQQKAYQKWIDSLRQKAFVRIY